MAGCRALLSDGSPDEGPARDIHPVRHGDDEVCVFNPADSGFEDHQGMPFHPACLKYSKEPRSIDLQPLISTDFGLWRYLEGSCDESLTFPRSNAVENGQQQYWADELGKRVLRRQSSQSSQLLKFSESSERDDIHGKPQPNSAFDGASTFDYNSAKERWKGMHETLPPTKTKDLFPASQANFDI
ncbi:uncharacterized protein RCO7_03005 [Rhynchosporium graminicola]|uniref:Uncharacterized protein n=1 Tax=Rhynchosporium graminicola TaxID=2792576 RepID=A0A1E1KRB5_9HELO|nr:uncharacterized protein RCO7_03005 [Rhynchosporium commune]